MPSDSSEKEKRIFLEAIEIGQKEARDAFLGETCGDDHALRQRIEKRLVAHEQPESLLGDAHLEDADATVALPTSVETSDDRVGPYHLRERIGEGGMGIVFVADQKEPLRRRVALKVIKPGLDTDAVIARFEAERQALAVMDHPNIAKVLDAGTTEKGRPYFVMELVNGIAITDYCDQHRLTISERLELFASVCEAIQHAHRKGIIHRDIKPSNVLVTEQDGRAIPKVIDFGVAKAIGQRLTDRTIYTSFQVVIGTPLYMSPEQAALSSSFA
ncbi:serine/threonine protein kinase, partial [Stieleria sp. ICT_E10.1]|uniref:serine/threonine-protein kinase n=1 Tax=Stieleria sedimenti TaxID=2976331 RepID=UPI00217F6055